MRFEERLIGKINPIPSEVETIPNKAIKIQRFKPIPGWNSSDIVEGLLSVGLMTL